MREEVRCKIYPANHLDGYKCVVICSYYEGKWLLSKHKNRATWELQGGHIEDGETPMDTARRELYEESGIKKADLYHVCNYLELDSKDSANGAVYLALVYELGQLPKSEMERTALFDNLPKNLTYPLVTPVFVRQAELFANKHHLLKKINKVMIVPLLL